MEWVDPEDFFVAHAAHRGRAFWLDGSGSRAWSGRMAYIGWLEPEELSLTLHASSGTVTAHTESRTEAVGTDIFTVLAEYGAEVTTGLRSSGWVGFFGYAARADRNHRPHRLLGLCRGSLPRGKRRPDAV